MGGRVGGRWLRGLAAIAHLLGQDPNPLTTSPTIVKQNAVIVILVGSRRGIGLSVGELPHLPALPKPALALRTGVILVLVGHEVENDIAAIDPDDVPSLVIAGPVALWIL